jgi:hypothetical protein
MRSALEEEYEVFIASNKSAALTTFERTDRGGDIDLPNQERRI